jgi:hypothetical protein
MDEPAQPPPDDAWKDIHIAPTAGPPLSFRGRIRALAWGVPVRRARDASSHFNVYLFDADDGRLIAEIVYETMMQSEASEREVMVFDAAEALVSTLRGYDPVAHLRFPPIRSDDPKAELKRKRQAATRRAVRDQWHEVLGRALAAAGLMERSAPRDRA